MVAMLGFDGELERFSRGLDTWVPLDSEASFGAMKRSIDVQRKASEGNGRARVLLRIKRAKPAQTSPPALTQFQQPPLQQPAPFPSLDDLFGDNQSTANVPSRMSIRPFVHDVYPLELGPNDILQPHQPHQPHPPQFGGQHPNMDPILQHMQPQTPQPPPPQMFFQPPPFPPNHGMPPPPPPPQPPFPFDNRPQRYFHHMPHHMPGGPRPFQSMLGAHPMPIPPLVPEPPSMPMMRDINRPASPAPQTEETDAEQVLSLLGMLQEKMQTMGDKVDQIHVEEKKHYESLRRGLKRIKDEKVTSPPVSASTYTKPADLPDHLQPYCICNYCLKGSSPEEWLTIGEVGTYVLCSTCDNFTLCLDCFMDDKYHHHPAHGFILENASLYENTSRLSEVRQRLGPGRGLKHRAHCDECNQVSTPQKPTNLEHCWRQAQMLQMSRL
jgi:hypothetical protein